MGNNLSKIREMLSAMNHAHLPSKLIGKERSPGEARAECSKLSMLAEQFVKDIRSGRIDRSEEEHVFGALCVREYFDFLVKEVGPKCLPREREFLWTLQREANGVLGVVIDESAYRIHCEDETEKLVAELAADTEKARAMRRVQS